MFLYKWSLFTLCMITCHMSILYFTVNSEMTMVIWCTAPTALNAIKISRNLVESKLVACVNVIPGVKSIYEWDGKIEESDEHLLFIKTRKELFQQVRERIIDLHEYDVPEIIGVPITHGHQPYLDWINFSTIIKTEL